MGVMMQTFYWDCPREDKKEFQWWNYINREIPNLAKAGFTSLWLPPVHKAANLGGPSMGYDPYDFYDLGEFDQKRKYGEWLKGWANDSSTTEITEFTEIFKRFSPCSLCALWLNLWLASPRN